ncbi:hypothetical protein QVD17_06549 [Tagetes erecta]|uniref:RPW8 domain-containing protein n=1 Tax=Tagetes erecta TaxID=13708 RepID=A0AAD8PBD3_TARER|nr:hypothetical protein QVD17_06549 [Tagetes erecta]
MLGELHELLVRHYVKDRIEQTIEFKPLPRLETTLRKIEPVFTEITASSKVLNRPDELTATFTSLLENGKELLVECLSVGEWSLLEKQNYANKLIHFDDELLRFFQIDLQAILLSSNLRILSGVNGLVDRGGSSGFSGCCSVPGLPEFTIGLDQHVKELKCNVLKDETRVLAVSAPEGFGKTTLVKKLCHDDHIKGIFGDNILYVTVSTETSLKSIARNLFKHYDINDFDFTSEEDAKNQIENLIKQKGSGKMLLVLDDVWPSTASVIQDLKFQLPGYKILVTTRFSFPQCDSMYKLSFLKPEYAKPLFCRSVFPSDQNPMYNVRDDFVNRVVEFCKGIPLALTVVGASLRGQAEDTWISTLKI